MDPQITLMNETTSYNLSEIWPIPINASGDGDMSGPGLDLRRSPFGPNLTRFVEPGLNIGNDSPRKRRENDNNNNVTDDSDSVAKAMSDSEGKRLKMAGQGDKNQNSKEGGGGNSGKGTEQKSKAVAEPPKDYIHVRARRGQATDSHSLAERARREKISERMRILQDLVPGCNKVIGKALVLDEIINYIQSLQRQVEFLSMKLEAVNSRMGPGIEGFPSKDFGQQAFDTSGIAYGSQNPREQYGRSTSPEWLHMQIGGGFDRQT